MISFPQFLYCRILSHGNLGIILRSMYVFETNVPSSYRLKGRPRGRGRRLQLLPW